ncbi:MAG TPA: amino acid adenylation domain-containing protein [Thermoanaerobaculia bacterium]|nr:amino acid adenylation domain-containing protein [Thermoanaerobaculia bacterium]
MNLQTSQTTATSLVDLLTARSRERGPQNAFLFLSDQGEERESLTYAELDARARTIAAALQAGGARGGRALLLYPPGLEFVAAFFGCLYAGVAAVPAYPPRMNRSLGRILAILEDARPRFILTVSALQPRIEAWLAEAGPRAPRCLATDALEGTAEGWQEPEVTAETVAFLQYTSGSTSTPKGVIVRHGNLLANEAMIRDAFGQSETSRVVGWLPLYHDMGLIGNVLQPLFVGARCVLMSPVAFLQRPALWLEAISRYRATTSGGPNFAYELCCRKVSDEELAGLDLGSWEVAFNGAEPVRADTMERFAARFARCGFRRETFYPCYGLAEATLFVSGGEKGAGPSVLRLGRAALERRRVEPGATEGGEVALVGAGREIAGGEVRVVDPETVAECPSGTVGEIWVAGPHVASGYWGREEESARTFGARLPGEPGTFLRTGDLGFFHGGELFVTGRLKDLIILRGRNLYPQDVELTVEASHPALRAGCGAAFSVEAGGEEVLVVVQEIEKRREDEAGPALAAARRAVAEEHEAALHEIVLLRAGTLPKTSSGKVQRHACRAAYLAGGLEVVARDAAAGPGEPAAPAPGLPAGGDGEYLRLQVARLARVAPESVDPRQPLTAVGLDSLMAVELRNAIERDLGVDIPLAGLLEGPSVEELSEELARLRAGAVPAVRRARPEEGPVSPLSPGQGALWLLHHLSGDGTPYHIVGAARVRGTVDPVALRRALERVAARHPALRTTFAAASGTPEQRVHPELAPGWAEVDASGWSEAELEATLLEAAYRPFDLGTGPLLRMDLFRRGEGAVLVLSVHHLVADLWSLSLLVRELSAFYADPEAALPRPAWAPTDFAAWQDSLLQGPRGEALWSYWREELAGPLPVLDLPADRPRPAARSWRGGARFRGLGADALAAVRTLAATRGATLYMVLLAGFQAFLHRSTGQDDLLVGSPTAGRSTPESESVVGYFVNPVVVRSAFAGDPAFGELLGQVRRKALGAFAHQDFPFALLAERLQPEREAGRSPVFQVMFTLARAPLPGQEGLGVFALGGEGGRLSLGDLVLESLPLADRRPEFDLQLNAAETAEGLGLSLTYDGALFDPATVDRMLGHLETLLRDAAGHPDRRVSELALLTAAEQGQLASWNDTNRDFARAGTIDRLFDEQVGRTPGAVAVVAGEESLTYRELQSRANQLARHLRGMGVVPGERVGVAVERSLDMMVGLLGILKAGGAYVPLDPSYPADRLAFMLADAGAPVLLTQAHLADRLPPARGERRVLLDGDWPAIARASDAPLEDRPDPGDLAYVIYTSGSTGHPKGAMNSHRAVVNRLLWMVEAHGLTPADRFLQKTPFSFDVSVWELFVPLICGARLVMARPGAHGDARYIAEVAAREGITTLHFVAPMLRVFLEEPAIAGCRALRRVVSSGEAVAFDLQQRFFESLPGVELHNLYGPTEAAVEVTSWVCDPAYPLPLVPIGRPIANVRIHLLGRHLEPVPVGVPGELMIGGICVARGYHGRPGLTAERFIPDLFASEPGARLYRTGDLARRLPGGEVDFLGRLDHQVKIRGFRIELGEVEACLLTHPGVAAAVVVARGAGTGFAFLAAYVVPSAGPTPAAPTDAELRDHLRATLPEHMVPAFFVRLESLPLSPNGKVDRRALPEPQVPARSGGSRAATQVEELLAGIWAEVLGLDEAAPDDSFFDLGGHSLLVGQIAARVAEALGMDLPLRTVFENPTPAALARSLEGDLAPGRASRVPPLCPLPQGTAPPLSFAQERIWFLSQLAPAPVYQEVLGLRITGPLDAEVLERCLAEVVRRHQALRTVFVTVDGGPAAVVLPDLFPAIQHVEAAGPEALARVAARLAWEPYDLATGPLLRASLVRCGEGEHALFLGMHHLVTDGWSWRVLVAEVAALYPAFAAGEPSPLPPLPVQYGDFAAWQRERFAGDALAPELTYWRERLAGLAAVLELPVDRPRPSIQSFAGAVESAWMPPATLELLRRVCRRSGTTLFMTLLAGFQALLHRATGTDDIAVGTPSASRDRTELEGVIGLFLNTLVLRGDLAGDPAFGELLRRVRGTALAAYAHRDLPFERLVEELRPERSLSHNPLVQTVLVLHEGVGREPEIPGLGFELLELDHGISKFDLVAGFRPEGERLLLRIEYASDLFDRPTVRRLAGHLGTLLAGAAAHPEARLSELPLLSGPERHQLTHEWNDRGTETGAETVVDLFLRQAAERPGRPALADSADRLTYAELDRAARRLAGRLVELWVRPEDRVALCTERSLAGVVAALAVLQAGAAYLPIDAAWPPERRAFMVRDAGARVLVTEGGVGAGWVPEGVAVVALDGEDWRGGPEPGFRPVPVDPRQAAYAIYTSGSTGVPKAVVVPHAGLSNLVAWHRRVYEVTAEDRATQIAATGFDAAVWEVWPYLASGASLSFPPSGIRSSAPDLVRWLAGEGITLSFLTTPLAEAALREPWPAESPLRVLLTGGDRLRGGAPRGVPFRFVNHYGPTESAVVATAGEVPAEAGGAPAIGRPIDNLRVHILDRWLRPVPAGVPGELCVAGAGLARGYLGRPDLTAERFLPDAWSTAPGARLYLTGDLARYRPDGEIEFLGRIDHQVKIRGVRIELGEIESAIARHPAVAEAVAMVRPGPAGEPWLAAYVVGRNGAAVDAAALRADLKRVLPEAMVPAVVVQLATLPLTVNGKVDRAALPEPERREGGMTSAAPATPTEELIAGLWSDLFGLEQVGTDEDLFALGGNSLLAARLAARLRETFRVDLPLQTVFEHPTVAGLARRLDELRGGPALPPLRPVPRDRDLPLSPAQQRLWFLDQLEPASPLYNIPLGLRLSGWLDVRALAASLSEVVRRHEALRTRFPAVGDGPVQVVDPPATLPLPVIDLSGVGETEAERLGREEAARPFDLAAGPLLRLTLLRVTPEEHLLLLTVHHIVADGWSIEVLVREVAALYPALLAGEPSPLPELPLQYADYALWQQRWLADGSVLDPQLAYWEERLAGSSPAIALPFDRPRPAAQSFRGARRAFTVPADLAAALQSLSRRQGATLFMVLLAGFQALLQRFSGQDDLVVGAPVANRRWRETEDLIGFFVNSIVLRCDLGGDPEVGGAIARVRDAVLAAQAHQDLPFERLVEHLQPARSLSHTPLFQVVFALQGPELGRIELPGLAASPVDDLHTGTAKFDLTVVLAQREDGLAGWCEHSTDLFDVATVGRLVEGYTRLLAGAAADPGLALSRLPLLGDADLRQVLVEWNETSSAYPADVPIHELFARQAASGPDRVAVIFEDRWLTYAELDFRADLLADRLRWLGVGPEVKVGVCLGRSPEMVVALLAILKAGGAYVPFDPSYPAERLALLMSTVRVPILLTQRSLRGSLPDGGEVRIVELDTFWRGPDAAGPAAPAMAVAPEGLAYVMFTSGSTGVPKAVGVPHRAVVRLVRDTDFACLDDRQVFLQLAPISFDAATLEIWGPLLNGGRLAIMPPHTPTLEEIGEALERHRVTTLWLTAALFHQMVDEQLPSLVPVPQILAGGDVLSVAHVRRLLAARRAGVLINGYGPTENTTFSCCHILPPGAPVGSSVPIGRPIRNSVAYVLDRHLGPVPVGVTGELYVGGDGLARGYLGAPDLTAGRFVPDLLSGEPGRRLYRTGDLARWLPDGTLEFLGRIDHQVKVRGFRIEPGEIEACLGRHEAVRDAVVVAREEAPGQRRLVAYVVLRPEGPDVSAVGLRSFVRERLPDYMVPAALVILPELPVTANGKVDRAALPAPGDLPRERPYAAPRSDSERVLAEIWGEVLGVAEIGIDDDFFDLGGHSLAATRVTAEIRRRFGVELPLARLFHRPTIAELSTVLEEALIAHLESLTDEEASKLA